MNRKAAKSLNFKFRVTQVTKDASGECVIEGYANTSTKDRVGDVVLPEAFEKSLETYQKNPVILLNHDWNDVIGRSTHQEITDKGLFIKARISDTRPDVKTLINEGCYSTFSIGYNEIDADYDESTKTKYIKALELLEISVVSVPANTEAMFTQITEKTDDESTTEEKGKEEQKKAKKVGDLKVLISDIKSIVGKGFDDETLNAVIDYFNSEEEIMTKDQMIALLKVKSATAVAASQDQEKAKDEAQAAAPADQAGQAGDMLKELAAKLDVIAQALGQLMEKVDAMGKEEASEEPQEKPEDKPADEKPADDEKKDDAEKKPEDEAKEDEEEKAKDDCDMDMDKEDDKKDEEEKELSLDEVNNTIADLTAQISALDDELNG